MIEKLILSRCDALKLTIELLSKSPYEVVTEIPQTLIEEGQSLLSERDSLVRQELLNYLGEMLRVETEQGAYQVPFLTIQEESAKHISWIGSSFARIYIAPFVAIRTLSEPNKISLRSISTSDVDCGNIAKGFGGGGHKHAAGFEKAITLNTEGIFEVSGN